MASKRSESSSRYLLLFNLTLVLALSAVLPGRAQSGNRQADQSSQATPVRARVTQPVDAQNLIPLRGNVHPLARAEYDRGVAPDDLPMERMLLVLRRGDDQEAALRQLLEDQQVKSSASYHAWLAPEEFGQRFGPADADIQAVTDWLTGQGFVVNQVAAGRTVIEFSGTAGLVRQGLHTEIHRFAVDGEERWANASDPEIPAALAPVVAGIASLNNFPRKPQFRNLGAFSRTKLTGELQPLFTVPGSSGTYYIVAPMDFATIYNLWPLWNTGLDGTGQTIAIVGETNINVSDVFSFRNLFGLPVNYPNIIVNGPDPGINGDEVEAVLDVEWSGAVAKGATIDLVVSESTEATAGIDLSSLYIIDNNLAPVMSQSYGYCEAFLGAGGNAFYYATREQGAAQGITIINSGGDAGSARCDGSYTEKAAQYGLAVSGLASTPFNVAVGGTDFDDVNTWSTYWYATNNTSTWSSAKSYIPESTWNDSCARFGQASRCASAASDTPAGIDHVAGGGGPSNCINPTGTPPYVTCSGGYPKPAWQSGTGVPADGARDIPDLSLLAGDGLNGSGYALCEADLLPPGYASCDRNAYQWYFEWIGGTSAAAPAFAGIMALVNQKTGARQGNANYVLYPLAAKSGSSCASNATMAPGANSSSCVFYDVVKGNNSVACVGGSPNCSNTSTAAGQYGIMATSAGGTTPAWTTTAGYDRATGLGSVNVANLVNKWNTVSFSPSTTTLSLSTTPPADPVTLTHGQPVNFTINVAPKSGSGTPTGDVSLIAQTGNYNSSTGNGGNGIGPFALSGGSISNTTSMLPGGTYNLIAHYAGNGTYGGSDSDPVPVTVGKEDSQTKVGVISCDYTSGACTSGVTSLTYGSTFEILRVDVTNAGGQPCASPTTGLIGYPCPTGTVTVTPTPPDLNAPWSATPGTYNLNSQGYTEDQYVQLPGGTNNLVANYLGDSSYGSSTSPTTPVTVTKGPTTTTMSGLPSTAVTGYVYLTITVSTQSTGVAPTGTVQLMDGNNPLPAGGDVSYTSGSTTRFASIQESLQPYLQVGTFSITAQYPGDNNYTASTSAAGTINVTDFSVSANPTTIDIPAPGQSGASTITITPVNGFTGTVNLGVAGGCPEGSTCTLSSPTATVAGTSAVTATLTVTTTGASSAMPRIPQRGAPPSSCLPFALPWLLAGLLALTTLLSLVAARRHPWGWLSATALLVVGVWAACGGGGTGGPPRASGPVATLSNTSLAFGQQNTGTTSAMQRVTLSNTGGALLTIQGIGMYGQDFGDFAQTNTCGLSVAAGKSCTISVTFTPTAAGARSADIEVADNAPGDPQGISLTGTGVGPDANLSTTSLPFGLGVVGVVSAPQNVTLSNPSASPLTVSSIAIGGFTPQDFTQTNNCGMSVPAGGSCSINVRFAPLVVGSLAATLAIADNALASPQTVSLTGTGVTPTPPGTYTVTVMVWSGNDDHYLYVPVVVQQGQGGRESRAVRRDGPSSRHTAWHVPGIGGRHD
jgi:hypothetical protein